MYPTDDGARAREIALGGAGGPQPLGRCIPLAWPSSRDAPVEDGVGGVRQKQPTRAELPSMPVANGG